MKQTLLVETIGTIHSPFKELDNMPIQSIGARNIEGKVVVDEEFVDGLRDLNGFSHIYLIYHFHQAKRTQLRVTPYMDTQERGIFATRSPLRPAHIGISIVELLTVTDNVLLIRGVDVLDGTPLIDIKPYIPLFDCWQAATSGWMKGSRADAESKCSDNRFA